MNFFEAVVTPEGGLKLASGLELDPGRPLAAPGERVTMGVRPEHLELAESGWPAEAAVIEPTGSETQITARLAGHTIRVLLRGRTGIQPGDHIHLRADPALIHVFATEAGRRI